MNHKAIKEQLLLYLDNNLPEEKKRLVDVHLSTCLICRDELIYLKHIQDFTKKFPRVTSPNIWDEIETHIQENHSIWTQLEWVGKRLVPLLAAAAVLLLSVMHITNHGDPIASLERYFLAQESIFLSEIEFSPHTVLGLEISNFK